MVEKYWKASKHMGVLVRNCLTHFWLMLLFYTWKIFWCFRVYILGILEIGQTECPWQ